MHGSKINWLVKSLPRRTGNEIRKFPGVVKTYQNPIRNRIRSRPTCTDPENAPVLYLRMRYAYARRVRTTSSVRNRVKHTERGCVIFTERVNAYIRNCLLYTSPSPRDRTRSRMPSSA